MTCFKRRSCHFTSCCFRTPLCTKRPLFVIATPLSVPFFFSSCCSYQLLYSSFGAPHASTRDPHPPVPDSNAGKQEARGGRGCQAQAHTTNAHWPKLHAARSIAHCMATYNELLLDIHLPAAGSTQLPWHTMCWAMRTASCITRPP
jgi:hypothetical protein